MLLLIGGTNSLFTRQHSYKVQFPDILGMNEGAKVVISGIRMGVVNKIDIDEKSQLVQVEILINHDYQHWVRKNTIAEVETQGLLGDKFVVLKNEGELGESLKEGSEIPSRPSQNINSMISKSDQVMESVTRVSLSLDKVIRTFDNNQKASQFFESMTTTSKNMAELSKKLNAEVDQMKLKSTVDHLNSIVEKINRGKGTLGALVNDPSLYEDAKSFIGHVNRNKILKNLVRQTIKDSDKEEQKKQ
jgi:phospholipid/cholesterol/gamma-HCH transport system substrate-binding protein